jgi:hypothetical protein
VTHNGMQAPVFVVCGLASCRQISRPSAPEARRDGRWQSASNRRQSSGRRCKPNSGAPKLTSGPDGPATYTYRPTNRSRWLKTPSAFLCQSWKRWTRHGLRCSVSC